MLGFAANPAAAGFTNVSDRAFLWQSGTVVPGAEGYVFWDDVHPTARTHALLGQAALAVVVPEPSGLTLAGIGAASAGLVALRRRRRAA